MNAIVIMLVSFVVLFIAYVTYGSWLAKKWGVDPKKETPAHTQQDGIDYVPAKSPVLLGHHFASIAGAGPINGPIQAAIFGWVPVLLWILIGGVFFGAVQDFSSLFASIRHGGKSIGHVIEVNIGKRGKRLFLVFAWLTLLLVVAAFADIVASTFVGIKPDGTLIPENGATACTSVLFIVVSIAFGFLVYRRNANLTVASIVGVACIATSIALGISFPIYMSKTVWLAIIFAYIFIASVAPVWILLQPRDYLNSFLLYAMMLAAFVGILFTNPTVNLPASTGFVVNGQYMFPMLFITVACGAISGFHSLVGSGTTAKQLDKEMDSKLIGYGGMLIECGLAVVALIAVGTLYANGKMPEGTPPVVFANAVSGFVANFGIPVNIARTVITLSISAFALTSLDTATRLGRYMFQEFFIAEGEDPESLTGFARLAANKYFSTLVTVILGGALAVGGYTNIWPLFGSANQLLAALALMAVAVWLGNVGKSNRMFYIPMAFMLVATLSALVITVKNNIVKLTNPEVQSFLYREGLQIVFAVLLFVLAVVLAIECVQALTKKKTGSTQA